MFLGVFRARIMAGNASFVARPSPMLRMSPSPQPGPSSTPHPSPAVRGGGPDAMPCNRARPRALKRAQRRGEDTPWWVGEGPARSVGGGRARVQRFSLLSCSSHAQKKHQRLLTQAMATALLAIFCALLPAPAYAEPPAFAPTLKRAMALRDTWVGRSYALWRTLWHQERLLGSP